MDEIKRGEIYYVEIPEGHNVGREMAKIRPAIIVSCSSLARNGAVVQVVYLSSTCDSDEPWHCTIRSSKVVSTALCEHLYTVDRTRVGDYTGRCTPAELAMVNSCILQALGLTEYAGPQTVEPAAHPALERRCIKAEAERDVYASMVERLLKGVVEL